MRSFSRVVGSLFVVSSVVLGACSTPDHAPGSFAARLGRTAQKIVNGKPSTSTQDATVMLVQGGDLACTATLITPNLILTARHCISNLDEETECGTIKSDFSASSFSIALGVDASPSSTVAKGKKIYAPKVKDLCDNQDIALIQLDKDVKEGKIAKVRFTPLEVGEKTVAVGYGDDGSGDLTPERYQRTNVAVTAIGPATTKYKTKQGQSLPVEAAANEIVTTESTCFGDSGGPLFDADGLVVGVTSRGIDEECVDRPTIWTGVSQWEDFIKEAAEKAGHPLDEATSTDDADEDEDTSKPSSKGDDDDDDDDDGDDDKRKEKDKTSTTNVNASCSAGVVAPASASTSGATLAVLGLALVSAASRRRR